MPELPEVETVRRGLAPHLVGARLSQVEARRPDLRIPLPEGFVQRLTGKHVTALERRGKYLLMQTGDGPTVIMHLGMSGRFTIHERRPQSAGHPAPIQPTPIQPGVFVHAAAPAQSALVSGPHDHIVFHTDAETAIVYTDHRRFGLMTFAEAGEEAEHPLLRAMGPEPLSEAFNARHLNEVLLGKRTPIKAALLDQHVVAGLGNIYVCEALFHARISPRRLANSVPGARAARLVDAVKTVLCEAIEAGGSSLRDYAQASGELGYFQHRFFVYGRDGEPCRVCGTELKRLVQSNRSTVYCPKCQR